MARIIQEVCPTYQVSLSNRQESLSIDKRHLIEVVKKTLHSERVASAEISVAVMGDEEIRAINREYLDHDYPPDVLSFVLESEGGLESKSVRGAGKILSGEILLGAEEAIRGGEKFDWPAQDELTL